MKPREICQKRNYFGTIITLFLCINKSFFTIINEQNTGAIPSKIRAENILITALEKEIII